MQKAHDLDERAAGAPVRDDAVVVAWAACAPIWLGLSTATP